MGKIVAIGGGENGRGDHPYETGPFDREIVRLTGKDDPNFLFIGLANSFSDSYYATMCDIFHGRLGCTHTDHLTEADLRDPDTLRRKMDVARQAGVHTFLAPWSEAGEHAAQLGLSRLSVPVQKGR